MSRCWLAVIPLLFFLGWSAQLQAANSMNDRDFKSAIIDQSTNEHFVLVTATSRKTNKTKVGCVSANALLGAIHRENGLGFDPHSLKLAEKMALNAPNHQFIFANPNALSNINFKHLERQYPEECALIRGGWTAMRGDIGWGLFTNKPGYQSKAGQNPH